MIEAHEIRIGNYFEHNDQWSYRSPDILKSFTFKWEKSDWYSIGESMLFLENVSPIPLSPSILEKCGFELHNTNGWFPFWTKKHTQVLVEWTFEIESVDEVEYRWLEGNTNVPFYYVHQLQNLWYSLTQTELKIQL